MSGNCNTETSKKEDIVNLVRYRKILWIALVINAAMFFVEIVAGLQAGSLSLLADAVDFAGDAVNYGVSLAVLASALAWRSRAAILKAFCMMGFGLYVLGAAVWSIWYGSPPQALAMGAVALVALAANVGVAWMLYAFREGDSNMRSVWLCSRNDAIGNLAVFIAALGVWVPVRGAAGKFVTGRLFLKTVLALGCMLAVALFAANFLASPR